MVDGSREYNGDRVSNRGPGRIAFGLTIKLAPITDNRRSNRVSAKVFVTHELVGDDDAGRVRGEPALGTPRESTLQAVRPLVHVIVKDVFVEGDSDPTTREIAGRE